MKALIDSMLFVHVLAGSVSLMLFWIPVFARKRKGLHTKVGKWYSYLMWVVVITAAVLSVKNLIIGHYNQALFLGFLSVITANPLWYAIGVMKHKKGLTPQFVNRYAIWQMIMVSFGAFLLVYGAFFVSEGVSYLMIFFGLLGMTGIRELSQVRSMKASKPDWYRMHYSGMIVTGIAAYTAFFSFGGRTFFSQILTNEWQIIPWVLPTVIGVLAMRIMDRKRRIARTIRSTYS